MLEPQKSITKTRRVEISGLQLLIGLLSLSFRSWAEQLAYEQPH
jgi:hypothetical protein